MRRTASEGLGDGVMTQISCMLWTIFCWFGSLTLRVQVELMLHREEIPQTQLPTNKKKKNDTDEVILSCRESSSEIKGR